MRKAIAVLAMLSFLAWPIVAMSADQDSELAQIQEKIREQGLSWTAGINAITKLSPEERAMRLGLIVPDDVKERFAELDKLPPPVLLNTEDIFDWRQMNGVTPVKDQANCGSCWDFAATGAFESSYLIAESVMVDFSEQQVLSCNTGGSSCSGGWMHDGYDLFMSYGAVDETCMPYQANDQIPCTQDQCVPIAYLDSYVDIPNNVAFIKNALLSGPLSTTFTVYDDFYYYQSGCYEHADQAPINHAVVIVGWDDDECNGQGAWIVKNSWGEGWGSLGGYFYIKYGSAAIGSYTQRPIYNESGVPEAVFPTEPIVADVPLGGQANVTLPLSNTGTGNLIFVMEAMNPTNADSFGYCWNDCDSPDGPTYGWIDITGIGQLVTFPGDIDDGNSGPLPLGFDFNYYGNTFDSISVCTNGWASFTDRYIVEFGNVGIPDPEPPNNMLAVFYDDLNMEIGGHIYFYTNNVDTAIITWHQVPDWRQEGIFTFQIILVAPDLVVYQYESMGPGRLDECSVGIENGTGTVGLEVVQDGQYVRDSLAVRFDLGQPPISPDIWLAVSPDNGVLAPDSSIAISLDFSAGALPLGSYNATFRVLTNDPLNGITDIPMVMNVGTIGIDGQRTQLPDEFKLNAVYPNPFNTAANISFGVPATGNVTAEAFNLLGQKVATIFNGFVSAGEHTLSWDASGLASGIYFVRLTFGERVQQAKVTLLK